MKGNPSFSPWRKGHNGNKLVYVFRFSLLTMLLLCSSAFHGIQYSKPWESGIESLTYSHKILRSTATSMKTTSSNEDIVNGDSSDYLGRPRSPLSREVEESRKFIRNGVMTSLLLSLLSPLSTEKAFAASGSVPGVPLPKPSPRPKVYSVEMKSPPYLQPRSKQGEAGAINRMSDADIIFIGEHPLQPNGLKEDAKLVESLISRMFDSARSKGKKLAIGLEMVQRGPPTTVPSSFQKALDTYIENSASISFEDADAALIRDVEWESRWPISFDHYAPLFHFARSRGIPLIACGVASETQKRVAREGLEGLTDSDKTTFIPDIDGFLATVQKEGFKKYADRIISPGYKSEIAGIKDVSPENYLGYRIFCDEGVASYAARYVNDNPNTVMAVLTTMDRVVFGYGVQERAERFLASLNSMNVASEDGASTTSSSSPSLERERVISLLMNPSAIDSFSYTAQLQLALAYGAQLQNQRPLANFLWYYSDPPVRWLTRMKNPINNEGEKPEGEDSVLKAF